jgi:hypothetical protein
MLVIAKGKQVEQSDESMNASGPSSKVQNLARHLIAYEAIGGNNYEVAWSAAFRVCEKLRGPLSTLTGAAGFRSLLSRALVLAKREVSSLDVVEVKDDGSLHGLNCDTAEAGDPLLIAHLLGLLITFIGDALTMRLLIEIWPNLLRDELNSEERE